MTLPDERYRSMIQGRDFLYDLCDSKKTPGVPRAVRDRARAVLRHYPDVFHLERLAQASPEIIQPRIEELTRMILHYEQTKKSG